MSGMNERLNIGRFRQQPTYSGECLDSSIQGELKPNINGPIIHVVAQHLRLTCAVACCQEITSGR